MADCNPRRLLARADCNPRRPLQTMKDMQAMKDITKWVKVKEKEIKEMKEKRGKHLHKLGCRLMQDKWVRRCLG